MTEKIEINLLLLILLYLWFLLTLGMLVYVWRNFDFDDRKKERPTIADFVRYQEEIRMRLADKKASEPKP